MTPHLPFAARFLPAFFSPAFFSSASLSTSPGWQRGLHLRGKEEAGENYRKMFASFAVEGFQTLQRFATEDRVADDCIVTAVLTGDGFVNAPASVGSKVEIRLLHLFEMREGKISLEPVHPPAKLRDRAEVFVPHRPDFVARGEFPASAAFHKGQRLFNLEA